MSIDNGRAQVRALPIIDRYLTAIAIEASLIERIPLA